MMSDDVLYARKQMIIATVGGFLLGVALTTCIVLHIVTNHCTDRLYKMRRDDAERVDRLSAEYRDAIQNVKECSLHLQKGKN